MEFYIGMHRVKLAKHFSKCFISVNVLRGRKSDFEVNKWILDSGAFTELSTYGRYRSSVFEYGQQIFRWRTCGNLEFAVAQDYMCEPFILKKTGLTIHQHQRLTIQRYVDLIEDTNFSNVPILPVLQGYEPSDYAKHIEMYGGLLDRGQRVGVGSVCKRNSSPIEIVKVLETIKNKRPDLKLHGFGLKTTALKNAYILSMLYSADSMSWSYAARRSGGNPNALEEALNFIEKIELIAGTKPHQFVLSVGE